METKIIAPTVHLNGTSKGALMEGYGNAYAALEAAMAALSEACPNGRDYYPQGPDAFVAARDEHIAQMGALRDIRDNMMAKMEAL